MKKILKIIGIILLAAAIVAGIAFAVLKFNKNKGPEQENYTAVMSAEFSDFNENNQIFEFADRDKIRYKSIFEEKYGMDDENAQSFIDTPEEWLSCNMIIEIENAGETAAAVTGIKVADNGKNKLYLSESIGSTMQLVNAGSSTAVSISCLIRDNDISYDDFEKLVRSKDITLICAPVDADNIEDVPTEGLFEIKVTG